MDIVPVILSGGSGTRLWPLSREQSPKQLLALGSDQTLLQETALRVAQEALTRDCRVLAPIVVGNEHYRFVTAEQLREIGLTQSRVVLEPVGRNTAPALTVAALVACEAAPDADPILVVMPADHVIRDLAVFRQALTVALEWANKGSVVTFGIVPDRAETGYGYIEKGETRPGEQEVYAIARFVEKPDAIRAEEYFVSRRYLWNSGIFVVKSRVWQRHIETLRADIFAACQKAVVRAVRDYDFFRVDHDAFLACPSDSIDYAVMERLGEAGGDGVVVPLDAGWSDVGSWRALFDIGDKDAEGNVLAGDVLALDTHNCYLRSESRLVATCGLNDTVVVETPDAILVAHKDQVQRVKDIVAELKAKGRSECDAHRKIYRPWGYYDSIDSGSRFQVKRIVVNPGAKLSLQMHHHRAEHWIVVRGTARVTRGEEVFLLSENQSTYIPLGTVHRLENPGKLPLEMIEVQSGGYLGEDDIVRIEDHYGRG